MIEGMSPFEFERTYHIIEGRPAKKAPALLAEFQRRGGRHKIHKMTEAEFSATVTHPELCPDGLTLTLTMKDLEKRGLTQGKNGLKKNYRQAPAAMLKWRALTELIRSVDPAIISGMYVAEETEAFDGAEPVIARVAPEDVQARREPKALPESTMVEPDPEPAEAPSRLSRMLRAFESIGVLAADIERYTGKALEDLSHADMDALTSLYAEGRALAGEDRQAWLIGTFQPEPGSMG